MLEVMEAGAEVRKVWEGLESVNWGLMLHWGGWSKRK